MKPLMFAGESMTLSNLHLNGPSCGETRWGKFAPTTVPVGGGEFPFRHEIPAFGWERVPGLPALPAAAVEGISPRRSWRVWRRWYLRRVVAEQDGFAGPASSEWATSSSPEVAA